MLKLIHVFAFLLFGCTQAFAAVTLDNCEATPTSLSGSGPITDNGFTVGAGSNQLLVLFIAQSASTAVTSATWNGVALTTIASISNSPVRTEILILKVPAQGNQSLVITASPAYSTSNAILCSFNGVDQSFPTQSSNSQVSFSTSVSSATGNMAVATSAGNISLTAANNTTIYVNSTNKTAANRASGAASVAMTFTGTGTSAISAMDIVAAAAPGTVALSGCTAVHVGGTSVTTITSNTFAVGGSNIAIVGLVSFFSGSTNPTLVYDPAGANQTMTQIGLLHAGSDTIGLYGLVAPSTTGTKTVQATWSGAATGNISGCAFKGVDQTGGVTSFPNYVSASSGGSVTVTSTTNNVAVGNFAASGSFSAVNQTQIYNENSLVSSGGNYALNIANPAMTGTGTGTIIAQGASIKAAGGGGGPTCNGGLLLRAAGGC